MFAYYVASLDDCKFFSIVSILQANLMKVFARLPLWRNRMYYLYSLRWLLNTTYQHAEYLWMDSSRQPDVLCI